MSQDTYKISELPLESTPPPSGYLEASIPTPSGYVSKKVRVDSVGGDDKIKQLVILWASC
ncbi:MAG: hypothetical protein ACP6IQ_02410 [Candidatus Njordarchaeia archaeon]